MRVGIIGVGTIGEIIAERLGKEGHELFAYDIRSERLQEMAGSHGVTAVKNNAEVIAASEFVVVAVKPQCFSALVQEIGETKLEGKLLVSVLALTSGLAYTSVAQPRLHQKAIKRVDRVLNSVGLTTLLVMPGSESD